MKFSIGSDPEFMVMRDGKYYSAFNIVQGDAENRICVRGHEFYYDNVMAECAIKPATSKKQFIENVRECLGIYADMVRPFKLVAQASQEYPDSELEDSRARQVGCAPDMCSYRMEMQDPPVDLIKNGSLRSCGGHIHLGSEFLAADGPDPNRTVYMLDLFLGIPSLWLDNDQTSICRRSLYGQAGRYRPKEYGIEYRSLGNFWLQSPELVELTYDLCDFVLNFVANGEAAKYWEFDQDVFFESDNLADAWTCNGYDPNGLRRSIDESKKELAEPYLELAKSHLPLKLRKNLDKAIKNPHHDMYAEWGLS